MKTNPEQTWKWPSVWGHIIWPIDPSETRDSKRIQNWWVEGSEPIELIIWDTKVLILSITQEWNQWIISINAPRDFELNPTVEQEIKTSLSAFTWLLFPETKYKIAA